MPATNVKDYFLGIVTRKDIPFFQRRKYIRITSEQKKLLGYAGVFLTQPHFLRKPWQNTPVLFGLNVDSVSHLKDGDIVMADSQGNIRLLWDLSVQDNCLLLTEACNCRCLTCPQPPKRHTERYFSIASRTLQLLDPIYVERICLTGGEPTLYKEELLAILYTCKKRFPLASVMILTNGKQLSDFEYAKKIVSVGIKKLLLCVSLHADVDTLHDAIVGSPGSFAQTVRGIQNLARLSQPVEIRFVISKMNYKRVETFSNFVSRNFPFAVHVAFMGLEMTGLAVNNRECIWIDPTNYQNELAVAVNDLRRKAINTSIYNVPLCLLRSDAWSFARQSISGWKNAYLPVCSDCRFSKECCGIFTTSGILQSPNICPPKELSTTCYKHV